MNRAEGTGLVVAVLAHAALLAVLSAMFLHPAQPPLKRTDTIEVSLSDVVGLESQAPVVSTEAPAPRLSEVEAPVEPEPAEPEPADAPEPEPAPKPKPPQPKPAPAPDAKPAKPLPPTNNAPRRRPDRSVAATGNLDGIVGGISNEKTNSKSTTPPSKTPGPTERSALDAEIRRQLKRHWRSPSGADIELLRTIVELRLNRDGSLAAEPRLVKQEGVTPSNRPQAQLHFEQAVKAIKLAAPFKNLPPEFYDYWKRTGPAFDRRLSQ